jgi:peroxiredoxin
MGKYLKSIEVVANVLIIVVAVLCLAIVAQRYFRPQQPAPPPTARTEPALKTPAIGSTISSVDVDWTRNKKNVVLVLQEGCRFCTESADFYKALVQQTKDKGVSVTAVLPQDRDVARKYLDKLQLSEINTKQSALNSLDVSATPTLIVANDKGQVEKVWVGKLPSEKQNEVLAAVLK